MAAADARWQVHPLTPDRWPGLERLFGPQGAYGGCWCMFWKLKGTDFGRLRGEGTRQALKALVDAGEVPGLLAYLDGEPAGWCAVAPREAYPRLERSRTLGRVDDAPVWSVVCFYVARPHRRAGVMARLLGAAVEHAAARGARIVEGYPVDPGDARIPSSAAYTGVAGAFRRAGFVEVARRSDHRPIMRYVVSEEQDVAEGAAAP